MAELKITPEQEKQLLEYIDELNKSVTLVNTANAVEIEFKVYYDEEGSIIAYSTTPQEGNYIVITREQYQLARHDAKVVDRQLVYTHTRQHVMKLTKSVTGTLTTKYDVNILVNEEDTGDTLRYILKAHEIKR